MATLGMTNASEPLLRLDDLRVLYPSERGWVPAVDGVSFAVPTGSTYALVGESGCGKTSIALAALRLLEGARISGRVVFEGRDLMALGAGDMRRVRGDRIAMIFQEPMTSLNPVMRAGRQISEVLELHRGMNPAQAAEAAVELLKRVRLPDPARQALCYPHELSGGMKQRVMIAMALACEPRLLIADEPTTALDVTIQAQILDLMRELCASQGMSLLLITHNLGIVAEMAQRVGVMYAGRLVEEAPVEELLRAPQHPYTRMLLASLPGRVAPRGRLAVIPGSVPSPGSLQSGCRFAPRCDRELRGCSTSEPALLSIAPGQLAACHLHDRAFPVEPVPKEPVLAATSSEPSSSALSASPREKKLVLASASSAALAARNGAGPVLQTQGMAVHFPILRGWLRREVGAVRAVDGVDLTFEGGRTLALVGESGCGKTTLGKALIRLIEPTGGRILYGGGDLAALSGRELKAARKHLQIIFQDPYSSLDPRMTVGDIVGEGLRAQGMVKNRREMLERASAALRRVQLNEDSLTRYPHEFSGGQRQRIGIARALAVEPEFIVCDEVTSALDVSVQAQILNLLAALQAESALSFLFITHDLSIVRHLGDRVAVMYLGRVVEEGPSEAIFADPLHPYTRALIAAAPSPIPGAPRGKALAGDVPSAANPPPGCPFHPRCPEAKDICRSRYPASSLQHQGRRVNCHLYPGA